MEGILAWEQDLAQTVERAGRIPGKERMVERLYRLDLLKEKITDLIGYEIREIKHFEGEETASYSFS